MEGIERSNIVRELEEQSQGKEPKIQIPNQLYYDNVIDVFKNFAG